MWEARSYTKHCILFHSSSNSTRDTTIHIFFSEEKAEGQRDQGDLVGLWIRKHGLMQSPEKTYGTGMTWGPVFLPTKVCSWWDCWLWNGFIPEYSPAFSISNCDSSHGEHLPVDYGPTQGDWLSFCRQEESCGRVESSFHHDALQNGEALPLDYLIQ